MSAKPDPRPQPMPMDLSILWNPSLPGAKSSGRAPYPIFFQQEAVIALQEHLKSSPTQAVFGFLIGDVFRDPETGVLYVVIDKTLRLSQAIYGDKTEVVVSRLWERMQEQLGRANATLLGWYHSHPGQGGYLTPHDVETHEKFFTDPWHVAILVAAEAGGVTGRFFRAGQHPDWHKTPLPFYELLQPDSIKADGKKRSFITWRNYKAYTPSLTGPKPKPPPQPTPPAADAPEPKGFRIMRSSADDIPVIRTSADDEPAPPPVPQPPPPPAPPAPPPRRASPPVLIPEEPEPPPIEKSGDLPWEVTPEDLGQMRPTPPLPPEPRRKRKPIFRLFGRKGEDEEAEKKEKEKPKPAPKPAAARRPKRRRRRGPWLRRLVFLLLLGGAGYGAYWYVTTRPPGTPPPWAGIVDGVKRLVSSLTSPPRRATAPPRTTPRRAAPPPPPHAGSPPPAPVPVPVPVPVPQPVASPFARFDRLSDSLSRAVRRFQDRAAQSASGQIDCNGLASNLVVVENLWTVYNTERRARMADFDLQRSAQDQALYAAVDSVESRFEQSGCQRP